MALTLSGTNGVVGAGFTVDASGVSVTAGVGTFGSLAAPAAGLTGALPALDAANLTSINAAQLVGVCTSGLTKTGGFGKIVQVVSATKTDVASNSTATETWWSYTDNSLKITLTPTSASNKIYLTAFFNMMDTTGQWLQFRFEQDGAQIDETVGDAASNRTRVTGQQLSGQDNNGGRFFMMAAEVNADSTSSRTYNLAFRHTSSTTRTLYLNRTGDDTDSVHYGRSISTLTAMEIAA
jgi:hypothetical protein